MQQGLILNERERCYWSDKMCKMRLTGLFPSAGSRHKSVPCFFQLLEVSDIPWLLAISLQSLLPLSYLPPTPFSPIFLPPSYKDPCEYI